MTASAVAASNQGPGSLVPVRSLGSEAFAQFVFPAGLELQASSED